MIEGLVDERAEKNSAEDEWPAAPAGADHDGDGEAIGGPPDRLPDGVEETGVGHHFFEHQDQAGQRKEFAHRPYDAPPPERRLADCSRQWRRHHKRYRRAISAVRMP